MIKKIKSFWDNLKIKNKIAFFTGSVFMIILFSIIFDVWVLRLFMFDFNDIMTDNLRGGEIVSAIEKETDAFTQYVRSPMGESESELNDAMKHLKSALSSLNLDYNRLKDNRFSQLQSLKTCYSVYCDYRDEVLSGNLT